MLSCNVSKCTLMQPPLDQLTRAVYCCLPGSYLAGGTFQHRLTRALFRWFHPFPMPQELWGTRTPHWPTVNMYSDLLTCVATVPQAVSWVPCHQSRAHENKHRDIITSQKWQSRACETVFSARTNCSPQTSMGMPRLHCGLSVLPEFSGEDENILFWQDKYKFPIGM